jgi:hypothetical protein
LTSSSTAAPLAWAMVAAGAAPPRRGGGVDQEVDAAQRADSRFDQGLVRGVVAGVDRERYDAPAGGGGQLQGRGGQGPQVSGRDHHVDALLGEGQGDRLADAAAGAGDQGALAVQLQVHGCLLTGRSADRGGKMRRPLYARDRLGAGFGKRRSIPGRRARRRG